MSDIIDLLEYKIWQMKSLEDISHPVNLSMAPTNVAESYSRHDWVWYLRRAGRMKGD